DAAPAAAACACASAPPQRPARPRPRRRARPGPPPARRPPRAPKRPPRLRARRQPPARPAPRPRSRARRSRPPRRSPCPSPSPSHTFPRRCRSFLTVRMRASSRFARRSRALFSSAPVADWKRRLNSSRRVSAILRSSSSSLSSRSCLALKEISLSLDELRLHRQLLAREAERLLGERLGDAGELEHHPARLHHRDPALGRALAGAHAGLGRLLRERLVREDVDPDLAAAPDLAGHRDPRRLDLAVRDPAVLERLDAVVAELHGRLALGESVAAPAELLAVLELARHQHQAPPPSVGSGAGACVAGVSGSSAGAASVSGRGPRPRGPPGRPPGRAPGRRRRCTSPSPSRSCPRPRPPSRDAPRPSAAPPRRRRAWSWSPSRVSFIEAAPS